MSPALERVRTGVAGLDTVLDGGLFHAAVYRLSDQGRFELVLDGPELDSSVAPALYSFAGSDGSDVPLLVHRAGDDGGTVPLSERAVHLVAVSADDGHPADGSTAGGLRIYTCALREWRPEAWSVASPFPSKRRTQEPRLDWRPTLEVHGAAQPRGVLVHAGAPPQLHDGVVPRRDDPAVLGLGGVPAGRDVGVGSGDHEQHGGAV